MNSEAPTKFELVKTNQTSGVAPIPFDPGADIDRATTAAKALMRVVELTKPLTLNGKKYLFFEHWQTIGQFFRNSTGIEWSRSVSENGRIIGYEAKAVLYNGEGLIVGGAEACCMRDEPNWKSKPLFQLRSMAQTRAMSKALRCRFGFIPVLVGLEATPAEEMDSAQPVRPVKQAPSYHRENAEIEAKLEKLVLELAKGDMAQAETYMLQFSTVEKDGVVHRGFKWFDDPRLAQSKNSAKWIAATYGKAKEAVAALHRQGDSNPREPGDDKEGS